ncbi:MAG: site-specific integrase [Acidobacteria bacterium]|nr:site-specific integrase [Acidobacteriota bacterium]
MKQSNPLLQHVQAFFQEYLSAHRGLSANTTLAYRDALKLFLLFVVQHTGKSTVKLTLDDLNSDLVLEFLKDLETRRGNSTLTRNLRLAALRTFFTYLSSQDPLRAGQYQRIVTIPLKRTTQRLIGYLAVDEVKAILSTIDRTRVAGARDYVLLTVLYNTGARVQEVCSLRVGAVRLDSPALVTISGKGRKTRSVPLWAETACLLRDYLTERGRIDQPQAQVFLNARGKPLGRFGVRHIIHKRVAAATQRCPSLKGRKIGPHTFRHATAMHLLQAGVDLTVIKSWLGHVHLSTTHAYIEIDLEMKRKALSACCPISEAQSLRSLIEKNKDVIHWLESL